MGYPYNELISPAILLDNPGLTKDQYIRQFQETHSSPFVEFDITDPWDSFFKRGDIRSDRLPRVLNLKYSEEYEKFQTPTKDQSGLPLYPPSLISSSTEDGFIYKVIKHIGNQPENSQLLKCNSQKIIEITEEEIFNSESELFQKWPQFKPENIYDWSQVNGCFSVLMGDKKFLWKNTNGRFFLDDETLNKISSGFSVTGEYGYTDLILTAETIKHKAWKLLSRKGLKHLDTFLKDFPDVIPRYEKAVWNSHTSIYAKNNQMSNLDFIRFRITPKDSK